jgi:predicted MPP superfamily phosphohydrolase
MIRRPHQSFYDEPYFWDALIVLLLISSGVAAWWSFHALLIGHTSILLAAFCAMMSVGWLLTFYGSFIEPRRIVTKRLSLTIARSPKLRMVLVTDFHVGPYKGHAFLERIVQRVNALKPDVILLGGDFVDNKRSRIEELAPLQRLAAQLGVFAVIGNHDAGRYLTAGGVPYCTFDRSDEVSAYLTGLNVRMLRNEHASIKADGKEIVIAGIDDELMESCDTVAALANIEDDVPVILLSHSPDVLTDAHRKRAALTLCGHTHGGQIRLPFIGPLGPIPTRIPRRYDEGLFTLENGSAMFISHGVGETWARARLFCPPEIVVIEIN